MEKHQPRKRLSWSRLLLWVFASCVAGFYTILWFRSNPGDEHPLSTGTEGTTRAGAGSQGNPLVSIIVPARNEERNIRRVVTSLLEQDFGNYEVIVVDDGSTDATPRILDEIALTHPNANRLYVLRLRCLPPGWAGKPHALQAGTKEARGDWLLFTDADTWHAPTALRTAVATATRDRLDLLSLGTTQELPDFWGKVLMPMAYMGITMQYPPRQVNSENSKVALANGQFILLRRSVYELLGGYARPDLRATLLDDRDLARVFKENGYRLRLLDGRGLVRVRMYRGFRDAWRGWRKNVFLGSRGGLPFVSLQLLGLPLFIIFPFFTPLLALLAARHRGANEADRSDTEPRRRRFIERSADLSAPAERVVTPTEVLTASALALGPLLAYRVWVNKKLGVPWYYALTQPLAGAIFEGILAQSTWRVLTGKGVDWRGRAYYNGSSARKREQTVETLGTTSVKDREPNF